MTEMKKFKIYNRRFLVDTFQLRLVAVAAFHFLLVVVLFAAAIFAPVVIALQSGDISDRYVQQAARTYLVLHEHVWVPLAGAFILLILHNVYVTHRVAGPLLRLRRYLAAVGEGDLRNPIRFRKSDYLTKEAVVASDMVMALRDKVAALDRELQETSATWGDVKLAIARGNKEEFRQNSDELDGRFQRCRTRMNAFKTNGEPHSEVEDASAESEEPVGVEP